MPFLSKLKADWSKLREKEKANPGPVASWLRGLQAKLLQAAHDVYEPGPFECEHFHAEDRARNYLIFIDGTGNDRALDHDGDVETATTNVFRLFQAIDQSTDQLARYFPGVGSGEDDANPVSALFRKTGGKGGDRIMESAYLQLLKDHHPGDRIFLLGYSRGAAIARALANKIHKDGIRERGTARYAALSQDDQLRLDHIELEGERRCADVAFVGLWDTVEAFGLPFKSFQIFKNVKLSTKIGRAVHLVSIDEDRHPFLPTLIKYSERVEEIWFPGVHRDIGGGSSERSIADITLGVMSEKLKDLGVALLPFTPPLQPDALGEMNDNQDSGMKRTVRKIQVLGDTSAKPMLHSSVLDRRNAGLPPLSPELERLLRSKQFTRLES